MEENFQKKLDMMRKRRYNNNCTKQSELEEWEPIPLLSFVKSWRKLKNETN